jgi:hypothetical protein
LFRRPTRPSFSRPTRPSFPRPASSSSDTDTDTGTLASACKVFDCLVPMHGRWGAPSGVSMMISGSIVPRREESGDVFETQHCHCVPLGCSLRAVGDAGGRKSFGDLWLLLRNQYLLTDLAR